ncbi:MAG: radical SAM protein, partial [Candidatus Omnitrophota bacterium]
MLPLRNIKRFIAKAVKQPGYALRVFLKRSHAYLYYRLARGKSSPPEAITFFLTHKCNLHCKMCGQWGEGGVTKKEGAGFVEQELSLGTIQALLDEVSGFYPNITLFGGEPLLYKNIIQVIRSIKSRSLHCLMITNGSLIYGYARELVEAGLDELNISLDGKSQLHDDIRQMPGLYERITLGIKKVNQIKKELRCNKPLINLQCTVNRDNYLRLEEMVEVADELGADSLTYHNLIFTTTKVLAKQKEADIKLDASSKDWEGFAFASGIDAEALFNKFKLIAAIPHKFNIDFYPNFSSKA